jgi:FtsP/CotA-like multicopper oxidase with cupredoxin domain
VAWPVLTVQPRHMRMRILNGAVSRALQLNIQDGRGKNYNDRCRIVGADGGVIGKDRTGNLGGRAFPTTHGLFTSNAYRWDIVCDFRNLDGSLYLTNEPNEKLMVRALPWCAGYKHYIL